MAPGTPPTATATTGQTGSDRGDEEAERSEWVGVCVGGVGERRGEWQHKSGETYH